MASASQELLLCRPNATLDVVLEECHERSNMDAGRIIDGSSMSQLVMVDVTVAAARVL